MADTGTKNTKTKKSKEQKIEKYSAYFPVFLLLVSLVLQFSFFSFDEGDSGTKVNLFGFLGHYISKLGFYLTGKSIYIIPCVGIISAFILFKRKEANRIRLVIGCIFILIATSIFTELFGYSNSSLRGSGGNIFGRFTSDVLETLLGKSGRVLVSFGAFLYGVFCILRESPKNIDWKKLGDKFSGSRELILDAMIPEPGPVTEEKQSSEVPPPWIEVKKVGRKKTPVIEDRTLPPEIQTPLADYKNFQLEFKDEPSKNFRIQELKDTIARLKKEIESEESRNYSDMAPDESPEPEIYFKEASRDLKSKIHKDPIPLPHREDGEMDDEVLEEIYNPINPDDAFGTDEIVSEEEMAELLQHEKEPEFISVLENEEEINTYPPEEYFSAIETEAETETGDTILPESEPKLPFDSTVPPVTFLRKASYRIPTKLFHSNPQKKSDPMFKLEAEYLARRITEIIKEYGYDSKILAWEKGPIVTRFELSPPPGVKLSRITSLSDELRLYLATKSIRMVAPIPGKSSIGIEVPNKHRENVFLGDIIREKGDSPIIMSWILSWVRIVFPVRPSL